MLSVLLLVILVTVGGYAEILLGGRSFSTAHSGTASALGPGPNIGPDGEPVEAPVDRVRLDRGASAWQFEPWAEVVAREIRAAEWPLWNPYSATGKPLAANMQSAAFDPLLLAVHLHPTPLTWDLSFLLAFALGAAVSYAFLRHLRLVPVAAFAGAAAFVLSGHFFLYSNNHFFRAYLYLPALFLGIDRVTAHRRPLGVLGLASAIAGCFLVGMPESTLFVGGACAIYALFRISTSANRGRSAVALSAGVLLGVALVLPLAVLLAEYVGLSFNGHPPEALIGMQTDPGRWLLNWLVPFGAGDPSLGFLQTFTGTREWIGAGAFVAVLAALASHQYLRRTGTWIFALIGALYLAKIYGVPGIREIGRLPVLVIAVFPAFSPPVPAFCAAVLVGVGVHAVATSEVSRRAGVAALSLGGLGVALLLGANADVLRALPWEQAWRPFGFAAGVFVVAGAAVLLLRGRTAGVVLAGLVVVELLALAPRGIYAERAEPYVMPPAVAMVVYEGELRLEDRTFAFDARLFPDIAGALGVADVRTIDGLYPKRFFEYVMTFVQPLLQTRYVGGGHGGNPGEEAGRSEVADNPMWDLLGVRYVLTGGTPVEDATTLGALFASRPATAAVRPAVVGLSGDARSALFEHSGQEVTLPVPPAASAFSFAYGLQEEAYRDPAADGVDFVIVGEAVDGSSRELFRATVDPRSGEPPRWTSGSVPAVDALGKALRSLVLRVDARANSNTDWAAWADPDFVEPVGSAPAGEAAQYVPLGIAGDTTVFRNTRVAPRAFVVQDVVGVEDIADAVEHFESTEGRFPGGAVHVTRFDPATTAVIEGAEDTTRACERPAHASITEYELQRVEIRVDAACAGTLVLTDTYYPGWQAEVDGRPAEVRPANILFRAVEVPAGTSTVTFEYAPKNFRRALVAPPLGLAVWAAWVVLRRRRAGQAGDGRVPAT